MEVKMRKRIIALCMVLAFTAATAAAAYAFVCKVESIEGGKVVMKCKSKDVKKLSVGQQAKVKKKVEGC